MQPEAGKFYTTRGGRKAFVAHVGNPIDPEESYTVVGFIERHRGSVCWTANGVWDSTHQDHPYDLIAPWREPVSVPVYLYQDGDYAFVRHEAIAREGLKLLAKGRITEGEGMS